MRRFIIERDGQQIGQGVRLADGRAFATVLGDRYDAPSMARVDPEIYADVGKAIGADVKVTFLDQPPPEPMQAGGVPMTKKVQAPCPGCGASLFALSISTEDKGVSKLHAEPSPFATFVRLETVHLVCANGCEVNVHRESGEQTAKRLEEIGALPLVAEVLR